MNLLKSYYQGILSKLKSEVDLINQLVPHSVTKGSLNENSLKQIIKSFIPSKYSVGSGVIIDSFGNKSSQIDILIYNSYSYPNIFNSSSIFLFPVEVVVATIEVKTFLNADALEKSSNIFNSVNALKHYTDKIERVRMSKTKKNAIEHSTLNTRPPMNFNFTNKISPETLTTLTLLIAESNSKDKDKMIGLVLLLLKK